jgi:hypothetical protein
MRCDQASDLSRTLASSSGTAPRSHFGGLLVGAFTPEICSLVLFETLVPPQTVLVRQLG